MNFKIVMSIIATALINQVNGNELGVATGINSSFYHSWYSQKSEFQKTDLFNPVEIYFRHNFSRFFGIHSALQFTKKSISESYYQITDFNGVPTVTGQVRWEISNNFISVQVSPFLSHKFNKITADFQAGLNGDIYINQWARFDGIEKVYRDKNIYPVMLSVVTGCGVSYPLKSHITIGIRSRISRTVTDRYKQMFVDHEAFFLNWYTVLFAGYEF
jgi:hypothetical protein